MVLPSFPLEREEENYLSGSHSLHSTAEKENNKVEELLRVDIENKIKKFSLQ